MVKKEGVTLYQNAKSMFRGRVNPSQVFSIKDANANFSRYTERANAFLEAGNVLEREGNYKLAALAYKDAKSYVENAVTYSPDYIKQDNWAAKLKQVEKSITSMNVKRGIKIGGYLEKRKQRNSDLTSRVSPVIAIAGVLGGMFFLSPNITGNAIAEMNITSSSMIGAGLMLIGLVAGYFWIKNK